MTTQQQAFDAKVEQKINEMMPYLKIVSGGNEDFIQEGSIGIWQSMQKDSEARLKLTLPGEKNHLTHRWHRCVATEQSFHLRQED